MGGASNASRSLSLGWRIVLSTSGTLALVLAAAAWIVQNHAFEVTSRSLEDEVNASFQAYESLWKTRAESLAAISRVLSNMSDVRAAFGTGDAGTIRDSASELWRTAGSPGSVFLVTDPNGRVIAALGSRLGAVLGTDLEVVRRAGARFPEQATGFLVAGESLFEVVITPVYVQSGSGSALLNVLVTAEPVDASVGRRLRESTGGSEFVFLSKGRVISSTLDNADARYLDSFASLEPSRPARIALAGVEYTSLPTPLRDISGQPIGTLWILRSFEAGRQRIAALRRDIILISLAALAIGLGMMFLLGQRIVKPIRALDRAAAEVTRQNYDYRVPVTSGDEIGRLADTFNSMCVSIQAARKELIAQERIATIARLSSSIVHDLRNPLAAIYGGAEMLVDSDLPPKQVRRLAENIYRATRRIQELLRDLVDVSRGAGQEREVCRLLDLAEAAREAVLSQAETSGVSIEIAVGPELEAPASRARVERVIANLLGNAIEAMPEGGRISVSASATAEGVVFTVSDNGPGVAAEIRDKLFEPFTSAGKKYGLGLGLALSRQTIRDHGGELWQEPLSGRGACFKFRLPVTPQGSLTAA